MVGTSGSDDTRFFPVVASARSLPSRMFSSVGPTVANCMSSRPVMISIEFFVQAEDGIRVLTVTGVQTCALPIFFWQCRITAIIFAVLIDGIEQEAAVRIGAIAKLPAIHEILWCLRKIFPDHRLEIGRQSAVAQLVTLQGNRGDDKFALSLDARCFSRRLFQRRREHTRQEIFGGAGIVMLPDALICFGAPGLRGDEGLGAPRSARDFQHSLERLHVSQLVVV